MEVASASSVMAAALGHSAMAKACGDTHSRQRDRRRVPSPVPCQPHALRSHRLLGRGRRSSADLRSPGHAAYRASPAEARNQVRRQRPTSRTTQVSVTVTDVLRQHRRKRHDVTGGHHFASVWPKRRKLSAAASRFAADSTISSASPTVLWSRVCASVQRR